MGRRGRPPKYPNKIPVNSKTEIVNGKEVAKFEIFKKKLLDEEFYCLSRREKARVMGMSRPRISEWEGMVDWEEITKKYRNTYAKFKPAIDYALIRGAMRGKEKSIELFYQKYEGWSPKSGIDVNVRKEFEGLDNKELVGILLKDMTEAERRGFLEWKWLEETADESLKSLERLEQTERKEPEDDVPM